MSQRFRPELQGLRAVAVGLVVAYHLRPDAVPGGFVGVDVFFVISGFLITQQLVAMSDRPEGISLRAFWAGRIRRLLPAATVVLVASLIAMLLVLPPSLWQGTAPQIAASAAYVENWTLAVASVDYLAADTAPSLVQHFWSLSVEEQFYLVWPLLILAAVVVRRRGAKAVLLSLVLVASLAYSIVAVDDPASYFNTGTRAWEFAAGGLLALLPGLRMPRALAGLAPWAGIASWAGLAMIAVAAFAFDGSTPFPGAAALLPVAGSVLFIAAGHGALWSAGGLAGLPPLRFIGDLSYSIYLWHWPIIVVAGYLLGTKPGLLSSLVILALTIVLSWLTKRFVEDPPRYAPVLQRRSRLVYLGAVGMVGVLAAASGVVWLGVQAGTQATARAAESAIASDPCFGAAAMRNPEQCADRFDPAGVDTAFAGQDRGALARPECNSTGVEPVACEFGQTQNPTLTVAVVGNSHAAALLPAFEEYGKSRGWRILLLRKTDCLGISTLPMPQPGGQACTDWTQNVRERLLADDIDVVAFATHRNALYYLADDKTNTVDTSRLLPEIADGYAMLRDAGNTVVVVGATPGTRPVPAPECVFRNRTVDDPCVRPMPDDGMDDGNIAMLAAQATPGITTVSLLPSVCDGTGCHAVIGGVVVYFDDNHLSTTFARTLAPVVGGAVDRALARRSG